MANIRVACAHVNKPHDSNGNIKIGTVVLHFLRHKGRSMCEVIERTKKNKVTDLEVPCTYVPLCSKAAADQEAGRFSSKLVLQATPFANNYFKMGQLTAS